MIYVQIKYMPPEVEFLVLLCRCISPQVLQVQPKPWPRPPPPLYSIYVSQHRSQTAIGQKKVSTHCLVYNIDKLNRDREKSSGSDPSVQYMNNRSHGQNLRSTTGQTVSKTVCGWEVIGFVESCWRPYSAGV